MTGIYQAIAKPTGSSSPRHILFSVAPVEGHTTCQAFCAKSIF